MIRSLAVAALAAPVALAQNDETVLGVYMFHRHGDRTAKSTPPANLTDLGYFQVWTSGQYYRNRYIASNATYRINGVNTDLVKPSQIAVSAPDDTVLQNSAMGFLQGLYPPVGDALGTQTLRDGTKVTSPLNGYQLIPVDLVTSGSGSEDSGWLQSTSNCAQATISSNDYFSSEEYMNTLNSTREFYSNLLPVINGTFNSSQDNFKNAYTIFDLINVAEIHNATINSSDLLTNETLFQLRTLADQHEWNLAYNASDNMRAIAGKTLAAQIVQFLNGTITSKGKQKIGIQFGAYASFASFFGLAQLQKQSVDFTGVSDYASAMTFELFTNSSTKVSSSHYPAEDELYVRFLFHNGTTTEDSPPTAYPLFGGDSDVISWNDFASGMGKFAVGDTKDWCTACGNFTGTCAAYAPGGSASSSSSSEDGSSGTSGNGLSPAVNGVIGAMVTLAVILGLEALILAVGGLRVVSKKRLAGGANADKMSMNHWVQRESGPCAETVCLETWLPSNFIKAEVNSTRPAITMRQRLTYLLPNGSGVNPSDIHVGKDHLSFADAAKASVETRITIGLSELPKELQSILQDFHELHIRLASRRSYIPFLPTISRLPSGLHIFFTPRNPGQETKLCSLLQGIVSQDIQCGPHSETFSRPPVLSERFASSSTYQFFHGPDDLAEISEHIRRHFCPGLPVGSEIGQICKFVADAGSDAYVDYDYDVISHAVTITTLSTPPNGQGHSEQAFSHKIKPDDRLEVGILAPESPDEPEELKLGGYLTVVGEDDKPSATLFGFPARHHPLPAGDLTAFQVSFQAPTGLHPKVDIKFPAQHLQPPKDSCALHAYSTLPASLFIDRYQLDDKLFLESNNLVALRALSGEQDLEAPNWVLKQWGSAALLELAYPKQKSTSTDGWTVTIPMHLRYVNGTSETNKAGAVDLSWPVVFWACEAEEGLKMSTNPFDRVNLGYDGLFGPKTMFYHVPPSPADDVLVERLSVPFLDPIKAGWAPLGTSIVVLLGFVWICYKLFGGSASPGRDEKKTQ
ncbi:hypothetical protein AC578_3424 [Pseudocercospora eumusae]|uniref:Protein PBN1 n=1 Tax=Pseudocercospora eumusae TaxID=321146 RepID=A0A139HR26_9PEZI|nr:hypothetical protein AC578_3424 [Pseudocercospora eumusae]